MNNWKDIKSFTMTSVTTDKDNKKNEYIFKIDNEDSQMISNENGKENYNYIVIGDTSYTKDYTDNKWFKYTSKDEKNDELEKIDFDDKESSIEDKTTYKRIGEEACGKLTCFKYQVLDPAMIDSIEYIYFDNKEYTLRKTRDELKDGTVSESTFDYSNVKLSVPSPIKEGSPYDVPASAAPSQEEIERQVNEMNNSYNSSVDTSTTDTNTSPPEEIAPTDPYPVEEAVE